jgi:hypothetical protein
MAVGVESLNVWLVTANSWRSILYLSMENEIDKSGSV